MRKILFLTLISAIALLLSLSDDAVGGRRGGGGGGRGGGFGGGRPVGGGGGAVNPYGGGGFGSTSRSTTPISGPGGGSGYAGKGSGSYTTKGGATIDYKGAAAGGTTGSGATGGKYVGGIQVTGPGGRDVTKVGTGGAVKGPGGNVVAGKSGATVGSGPNGAFGTRYQGGVAVGPGGAVAGGTRGGIAAGPYGAVAGRSTVVAGRGTYYHGGAAIRNQGVYVRQSVAHYPCFRPGWYRQYPGAWYAAGWGAGAVWRAATWPAFAGYCGYPVDTAIYYNYGENVVYQDDGVYFDGQLAYPTEQYVEKATVLADAGRDAKVTDKEDWLPLGVFAMVQGEEKTSNHIFQLAVNKQGILRGNYYDAVTDATSVVVGSVDKKTQRAAWTVGDRKTPIYEAGIANLTENETTMLVHYGKDRTQQFSLIRIEDPDSKGKEPEITNGE
ncbi:MAG TPA: hypothetical protein VFE62_22405 [Gemmataceae bacterium]|nr:hypothetical protein [Gemmataceae bacterium]